MKPIYFPFTYISHSDCEALNICFEQVVIYQPSDMDIPESMQQLSDQGRIDIRLPVNKDISMLSRQFDEYKLWAQQHSEKGLSAFKHLQNNVPFFNKDSTFRIRSELKGKKPEKPEEKPDLTFQARLFLQLAQDLDVHNELIDQDLVNFQRLEDALFRDLKGEEDDESREKLPVMTSPEALKDVGRHMTAERLSAWFRLMSQDVDRSCVYVTTSSAVMDHLIEFAPDMEKLVDTNILQPQETLLSDFQSAFVSYLTSAIEMSEPEPFQTLPVDHADEDESTKTIHLTVYRAKGSPVNVFSRFASGDQIVDAETDTSPFTLIIGVETNET